MSHPKIKISTINNFTKKKSMKPISQKKMVYFFCKNNFTKKRGFNFSVKTISRKKRCLIFPFPGNTIFDTTWEVKYQSTMMNLQPRYQIWEVKYQSTMMNLQPRYQMVSFALLFLCISPVKKEFIPRPPKVECETFLVVKRHEIQWRDVGKVINPKVEVQLA